MPVYMYRKDSDGELVALRMSVLEMTERHAAVTGEPDGTIRLEDGSFARRNYRAEHTNVPPSGNYPMSSTAAGVHPEQRKEAETHSREIGIPTHFTGEGDAVFTSRAHRKEYCEAIGMYDRNGANSDPLPKNRT